MAKISLITLKNIGYFCQMLSKSNKRYINPLIIIMAVPKRKTTKSRSGKDLILI